MQNSLLNNKNLKNRYKEYKPLKKKEEEESKLWILGPCERIKELKKEVEWVVQLCYVK